MENERESSDQNKPRLRIVVKRLSRDTIEKEINPPKRVKSAIPNILTMCLACGQYTKLFPVQSGFENHICAENLNSFAACMRIIKSRVMDLVDLNSLTIPASLPTQAPSASSMPSTSTASPASQAPPVPPAPPASSALKLSQSITAIYIDELKEVLKKRGRIDD